MPLSKRLPIHTKIHFENLVQYLADADHPSHLEYDIRRGRIYGDLTPGEFIRKAHAAAERINQEKAGRPGAKLKTLGHFFIARFADGTFLDAAEEDEYEAALVRCLAADFEVLCYRHFNWETGSIDFNFIVPAWIGDPPRTRFSTKSNITARMMLISDKITDVLNVKRRTQGRSSIYTMQDMELARAHKKGEKLIVEEVAEAAPSKVLSFEELLVLLKNLGHETNNWNHDRNTISIIPRGKRKPVHCNLDNLLDAEATIQILKQSEDGWAEQLAERTEHFRLDKDAQVEAILEMDPRLNTLGL